MVRQRLILGQDLQEKQDIYFAFPEERQNISALFHAELSMSQSIASQFLPGSRRSEIELLLCCARRNVGSEACERVRSLVQNSIDWQYFVQITIQHRVMPLVYRNLQKTCPESVPVGTMDQLRRYFLVNAASNHILVHELFKD